MNSDAGYRAQIAAEVFEEHLRQFVQRWKPNDPRDLYDFQINLTRLFCDAMRSQGAYFSYAVDTMVSDQIRERSLAPLWAIMERPKP